MSRPNRSNSIATSNSGAGEIENWSRYVDKNSGANILVKKKREEQEQVSIGRRSQKQQKFRDERTEEKKEGLFIFGF